MDNQLFIANRVFEIALCIAGVLTVLKVFKYLRKAPSLKCLSLLIHTTMDYHVLWCTIMPPSSDDAKLPYCEPPYSEPLT